MPSKRKLRKLLALYTLYRKGQRRPYIRKVNASRCQRGEYYALIQELRDIDAERHHQYFRMSKEQFAELLKCIEESEAQKSCFLVKNRVDLQTGSEIGMQKVQNV